MDGDQNVIGKYFFSSRRRHTRCGRDWSSDVCSSDLRVTETIAAPRDSRILFINHMVDRACIGRCFTYSNYEPASRQFHIRARPGSPLVTDSVDSSQAMEDGKYVVRPQDLPMTQIDQCGGNDFTRLCRHDLAAGEKNGIVGDRSSAPQ